METHAMIPAETTDITNVTSASLSESPACLNEEAKELIAQIISEKDEQKANALVQLFNANQNKKAIVRVSKLSELLDTITDQALVRFTARPDEISNKELFDGLKIVQDLIDRGQRQVINHEETPLIQVNQQTNEVNIGGVTGELNRESRERVKTAVLNLLNNITSTTESKEPDAASFTVVQEDPIESEVTDDKE